MNKKLLKILTSIILITNISHYADATPQIGGGLSIAKTLGEFVKNGTQYLARASLNTVGYVQSIDTPGISNLVNFPVNGLVNGQVVYVGGYVTEGDAPQVAYAYSITTCPTNTPANGIPFTLVNGILTGGPGDSGSQIQSAISGCWNIVPQSRIDFRNFGGQGNTGSDVSSGPMTYIGTSTATAAMTGNAAAITNTWNYASGLSNAITGGQTMVDTTGGGEQYVTNYPTFESGPLVYFHDFTMLAGSSTYLSCAINQYIGMLNIQTSTVRAADRVTVDSNYMPINSIEVQANGTAKYSEMNARHWKGSCSTIVTAASATITGGSNIITFSPALAAGTITTHMIIRGDQAYGIPDRTVVMDVNPGGSPTAPITSIIISKPSILGQNVSSFNATFSVGTLPGQGLNDQGVGTLTTYNLMTVSSNTVNTGILGVNEGISGGSGVSIPAGTTITGGYGNTPSTYTISTPLTGTATGITASAIPGGSSVSGVSLTFNIDPNGITLGGNNKNTGDTFSDFTSAEYINSENDVNINALRFGFPLACYNTLNLSSSNSCNNINLNQDQLISGVAPFYIDKYAGGFSLNSGSIFQGGFNVGELDYPSILIGPDSGEDLVEGLDTNAPIYSFNTDGANEQFSLHRSKISNSQNTSFIPSALLDLYIGTSGTKGSSYSVDPIGIITPDGVKNLVEYGPNAPMSPDLNQWDFTESTLMNGAWTGGTIDGAVLGATSTVNITGANRIQFSGTSTAPIIGWNDCTQPNYYDMCGFVSSGGTTPTSTKVIIFDSAGITMNVPLIDSAAALTAPVITNGTMDGTSLGLTSYVNITGANRIQFTGLFTAPVIGLAGCGGTDLCGYASASGVSTKVFDASSSQITALVAINPSTTLGIIGTTSGDNANAGSIGEYPAGCSVSQGSSVSITSGTAASVCSFTLQPGDWNLWATIGLNPAGTTVINSVRAAINSSVGIPSATQGGVLQQYMSSAPAGSNFVFPVGMTRVDITTPTVEYLVINSTFTTSTNAAYGALFARRAR